VTKGIFHIVPTIESLGGMAKTVADLEEVTKIILSTAKMPVQLTVDHSKTWKDFSLGLCGPGFLATPLGAIHLNC
jgi:hypothetical protein